MRSRGFSTGARSATASCSNGRPPTAPARMAHHHRNATFRQLLIISGLSAPLTIVLLLEGEFAPTSVFVILLGGFAAADALAGAARRSRARGRSSARTRRSSCAAWRARPGASSTIWWARQSNWLPPDNYAAGAAGGGGAAHVAHQHRSLAHLRTGGARFRLSDGRTNCAWRCSHTMETLGRLERYEGHLLNWYDTRTLEPLNPRYVSTVDSGNLIAALWVLQQGLPRYAARADHRVTSGLRGLSDTLSILEEKCGDDPSATVALHALRRLLRGAQREGHELIAPLPHGARRRCRSCGKRSAGTLPRATNGLTGPRVSPPNWLRGPAPRIAICAGWKRWPRRPIPHCSRSARTRSGCAAGHCTRCLRWTALADRATGLWWIRFWPGEASRAAAGTGRVAGSAGRRIREPPAPTRRKR